MKYNIETIPHVASIYMTKDSAAVCAKNEEGRYDRIVTLLERRTEVMEQILSRQEINRRFDVRVSKKCGVPLEDYPFNLKIDEVKR
jgi:hypothetical protein